MAVHYTACRKCYNPTGEEIAGFNDVAEIIKFHIESGGNDEFLLEIKDMLDEYFLQEDIE
jgi:hypothetical protein